jgi:hypothetical protein
MVMGKVKDEHGKKSSRFYVGSLPYAFLLLSSKDVFSVGFSFFFFAAKYFSMIIPQLGHVENSISILMYLQLGQ